MKTHKIIYKKNVMFITEDTAKFYFSKLIDQNEQKIYIYDENELSFTQCYKNEVELKKLNEYESFLENKNLTDFQKKQCYNFIDEREIKTQKVTIDILKDYILTI